MADELLLRIDHERPDLVADVNEQGLAHLVGRADRLCVRMPVPVPVVPVAMTMGVTVAMPVLGRVVGTHVTPPAR